MNKLLFIILCFYSCLGISQNQNSLLWEISGNGLSKKSYLYGTIHQICSSNAYISPQFKKIIESSEEVYLEINFEDEINNFEGLYDNFLKNGKTLSSYYTHDEYLKLEKAFKKNFRPRGIQLKQLENYKPDKIIPWIIREKTYCYRWTSYEELISNIAKKKKIKIKSIESMRDRKTDNDSTVNAKARFLYSLISNERLRDSLTNEYLKLVEEYKEGSIDKIYQSATKEQNPTETYYLLDFRNNLWIPRMEKISSKKSVLYAVGAAHLGGENGLLNLLRDEGYILKPILSTK
ncbi:MAG: TraB/GumN family protein [Leadbetterella sp.]